MYWIIIDVVSKDYRVFARMPHTRSSPNYVRKRLNVQSVNPTPPMNIFFMFKTRRDV